MGYDRRRVAEAVSKLAAGRNISESASEREQAIFRLAIVELSAG
jgi:hypothetical protein